MRWLQEHFAAATLPPAAFDHGEICGEDLILGEVARRLKADGDLVAIFGSADRIDARHAVTFQDFAVTPALMVALNISALTEAPTSLDQHRLTVNLVNVLEAQSASRPVTPGDATLATLLSLERRILGTGDNRELLVNVGAALNVPLVREFEPGASLVFGPVLTDKGTSVLVAVQPIVYEVRIDHETGKVWNVVENGG